MRKIYPFIHNNSQVIKAHDYLNNNHISNKDLNYYLSQYLYILNFIISILELRKHITIRRLLSTSETLRLMLILVFFLKPLIIFNSRGTHSSPYERLWVYLIIFLLHIILILYFNLSYLNLYSDRCTLSFWVEGWVKVGDGSYIKDCIWLINVLIIKFNIGCLLHLYLINNKLIIYTPRQIMTKNNSTLSVEPHIVPSMYYKLGENVNAYYNFKPNSNTINKLTTKKSFSNTSINQSLSDNKIFNEWLSGLIDGRGHFNLTKKGIARLIIVMDIRDKKALFDIKHKFGGSIRTIAGANALKYKISHKKGLIALLEALNGLIRNPSRLLQMNKLCVKYRIELLYPKPLTYNNGWLSGFIDSDGSIHIEDKSLQLIISITQKNKYLLDPLQILYGGRIQILKSKDAFQYSIYRKEEILNLVNVYFKNFPLKSSKASRINLIKDFYRLRTHANFNVNKIYEFNQWVIFKDTWDKKNFSTLARRPIKSG